LVRGLRDYGLEPIIWDGDNPDCEHEWGDKLITASSAKSGGGGHKQDRNKGLWFKNYSFFCLKCSAWKGSFGHEPTPELYIKHLLEIFDEVKRVLKKNGSCWVNLADTYSGSGCGRWNAPIEIRGKQFRKCLNIDQEYLAPPRKCRHIPTKSLVGIPEMFVLGMRDRGWIRRNTIIWHKSNCMPSSVKDRFTVDFEYVYFFTKSQKYYFEQQFEEYAESFIATLNYRRHSKKADTGIMAGLTTENQWRAFQRAKEKQGRNKRCVWDIPTHPFPESHFAVFPKALVEPMIRAGCPPSGIVLDPFAGSGTTLVVTESLNRRWIGIELNKSYIDMAYKRLKGIQKCLI